MESNEMLDDFPAVLQRPSDVMTCSPMHLIQVHTRTHTHTQTHTHTHTPTHPHTHPHTHTHTHTHTQAHTHTHQVLQLKLGIVHLLTTNYSLLHSGHEN